MSFIETKAQAKAVGYKLKLFYTWCDFILTIRLTILLCDGFVVFYGIWRKETLEGENILITLAPERVMFKVFSSHTHIRQLLLGFHQSHLLHRRSLFRNSRLFTLFLRDMVIT